jgi:hypothetical protein
MLPHGLLFSIRCQRALFCGLAGAQLFVMSACRKSSEPTTTAAPQPAPAAPAASQRHHRMFTGGVSPLIVSMSPETIVVHNGHAPPTRYSLTYEISNSEKATKAYISVYARGVGEVQKFDVDVKPQGQIEFLLDASDIDLGPTVRFRARCPYGETDWFVMGSDPVDFQQRMSSREIGNVNPGYWQMRPGPQAGGIPITIWGGQFTKDCTPEAQIDFSSVDLQNVTANDKQITGILPFDALQGRPITARHLEVNLVINGPGMPAADVYNLNYAE